MRFAVGKLLCLGQVSLFSGQAELKQIFWLMLPALFLFYFGAVLLGFWRVHVLGTCMRATRYSVGAVLAQMFSTDWRSEQHSLKRIVKHCNRFVPMAVAIAVVLVALYVLPHANDTDYECTFNHL